MCKCWPNAGTSPIPTADCTQATGTPTSYISDPFDRDMGIWSLAGAGAQIVSGDLRPVSASGGATVPLRLFSQNPTGAQAVTLIKEIRYQKNNGATLGGDLRFGKSANFRQVGLGYYNGDGGAFWVSTSAGSPPGSTLFDSVLSDLNGSIYTHTIKVVITATQVFYYLDGVLKYTESLVVDLTDVNWPVSLRVSNTTGQFNYATLFTMFGFGLPVSC